MTAAVFGLARGVLPLPAGVSCNHSSSAAPSDCLRAAAEAGRRAGTSSSGAAVWPQSVAGLNSTTICFGRTSEHMGIALMFANSFGNLSRRPQSLAGRKGRGRLLAEATPGPLTGGDPAGVPVAR